MPDRFSLTDEEARELLGVRGKGVSRAAVEQAYAEQLRRWATTMNSALSFEQRERASDAIALLADAKAVCLASLPARGMQGAARPAGSAAPRSGSRRRRAARPGATAARRSAWRWFQTAARLTAPTVVAVPRVLMETRAGCGLALRELARLGIPRSGVVLTVILGLVTAFEGCRRGLRAHPRASLPTAALVEDTGRGGESE